ncbi:MAG: helix-turn-helix transcriptional regulator [Myxococcales bacterium]
MNFMHFYCMLLPDNDLIDQAKRLAGGTQRDLAEQLGVTPAAISNWLRAGRIPDEPRDRLLALIRERGSEPAAAVREPRDADEIPELLWQSRRGDIEQTRMWSRGAWCFNYVHAPTNGSSDFTSIDVWRAWEQLHTLPSSGKTHVSFRHWLSAEFDESSNTKPAPKGWGFLEADHVSGEVRHEGRKSVPAPPNMDMRRHKNVLYVAAHKRLPIGTAYESGGYHVSTPGGIRSKRSKEQSMEFVAFSPGCPTETAHVLVSIPRNAYAHPTACTIHAPYQLLYELAQLAGQPGALSSVEEFIEPWGKQLLVQRWDSPPSTLFETLQPELPSDFFGGGPDARDCLHIAVTVPNPLVRIAILWDIR